MDSQRDHGRNALLHHQNSETSFSRFPLILNEVKIIVLFMLSFILNQMVFFDNILKPQYCDIFRAQNIKHQYVHHLLQIYLNLIWISENKINDKFGVLGSPSIYKFMFQKNISSLIQKWNINLSSNSGCETIAKKSKQFSFRK